MRHAPPVQVRSQGAGWRLAQAGLVAVAAAAFSAWLLLHAEWAAWPAAPAALAAGLLVWRALPCDPVALAWDGQAWQADGVVGEVDVMLDMAGFLLVRFRPVPAVRARWIALSQRDTGVAEHALRVALYARARVAVDAATDLWRSG